MNSLIQRLDAKLREKNKVTDLLETIEKSYGVKRVYVVLALVSFVGLYLVIGYGAELICNCIGFVYPAYVSIHALESPNKEDDTKWLTYWVVFALFSLVEFFSDMVLNWFPFYWLAKCVFLIWCFAPISANGSHIIYGRVIRPFFLKNQKGIDGAFKKVTDKAKDAVGEAVKVVADGALKSD